MDKFLEQYWNLGQVKAWAQTRDPELVRLTAPHMWVANTSLLNTIRSAVATNEAKQAGRDIESELWAASGRPRPKQEPPIERLVSNDAVVDDLHVPSLVTLFPIDDYLLHLFRIGKLTALGNLPRDPVARNLSTADWAGLEIAEAGDFQRLSVWRIGKVRTVGHGDVPILRRCFARK